MPISLWGSLGQAGSGGSQGSCSGGCLPAVLRHCCPQCIFRLKHNKTEQLPIPSPASLRWTTACHSMWFNLCKGVTTSLFISKVSVSQQPDNWFLEQGQRSDLLAYPILSWVIPKKLRKPWLEVVNVSFNLCFSACCNEIFTVFQILQNVLVRLPWPVGFHTVLYASSFASLQSVIFNLSYTVYFHTSEENQAGVHSGEHCSAEDRVNAAQKEALLEEQGQPSPALTSPSLLQCKHLHITSHSLERRNHFQSESLQLHFLHSERCVGGILIIMLFV